MSDPPAREHEQKQGGEGQQPHDPPGGRGPVDQGLGRLADPFVRGIPGQQGPLPAYVREITAGEGLDEGVEPRVRGKALGEEGSRLLTVVQKFVDLRSIGATVRNMALQVAPLERRPAPSATSPHPRSGAGRDTDHILIIGAGFAGLGMAIRLKQAGIDDFTILEGADRLGGTWRDNTYPGIACDIPSHLYSYSFEPNPTWSKFFGPQREILAYLERCADKYGIASHIRFGTRANGATFDEATGLWTVETTHGERIVARVVVSGAGHALTKPVYPDVPGRDTFTGKTMHSARWDHDYSLEGKRVAVIGTGASAIQIVPSIAKRAGHMDVYQRTASWVMPKPDREISADEQTLFANHPGVQKLARRVIYWVLEMMALGYVVEPRLNKIREMLCLRYLDRKVKDPELRKKHTPSFRLGCKRILISNEYFDTLQQQNVELVTDGIAEIRPELDRHEGRQGAPARRHHLRHRLRDRRGQAAVQDQRQGRERPWPTRGRTASRPTSARRSRASPTRSCCSGPTPASGTRR